MAKKLNDFADLGELKEKLSQEDGVFPTKEIFNPIVPVRQQGNVYYDYNTYIEAAAAAVKAYPIISVNYKTIQFTFSQKKRYIALTGGIGHCHYFRFKMSSDKRIFRSTDRIAAFRAIMFAFREMRKIPASHILIVENVDIKNFVLFINEIPLIASSYTKFTGTFSMLKTLKEDMLNGDVLPTCENEENAQQMGINFQEKVNQSPIYDKLEIIPEIDYSVFCDDERIKVSTKVGYVEPERTSPKPRVIAGRSLPAMPKKLHSDNPWLDKWDDRLDHDD